MMKNPETSSSAVQAEFWRSVEPLDFICLHEKLMAFVEAEIDENLSRISYPEKIKHLISETDDSLLNSLEAYWRGFQLRNQWFDSEQNDGDYPPLRFGSAFMAQKPLLYLGKATAILVDTLGSVMSLKDGHNSDTYTKEACEFISSKMKNKAATLSQINRYQQLSIEEFAVTKMGLKIRQVSALIKQAEIGSADDFIWKHSISKAFHAAMCSLLVWQAYINGLNARDIKSMMPKPGLPTNGIEVWDSDAARIFESS